MIIKRVAAENFLKYRKLELNNLPVRGRIGISGPNESGKTAIGGTICFALFGRTFSLGPDELPKAIRWGEFRGVVRLEFTGRDGCDYLVVREIDTEGNQTVRLTRMGEREPLAHGVSAVAERIVDILGFGFEHFVSSFYLAQREMDVPQARSDTVKSLIGIKTLEDTAKNLQREVSSVTVSLAELDGQLADSRKQLVEAAFDSHALAQLETRRNEVAKARASADSAIADLDQRGQAVEKAATSFAMATEKFAHTTLGTRYAEWRTRKESVASTLVAVTAASEKAGCSPVIPVGLHEAGAMLESFEAGLDDYERISSLANSRRKRLQSMLGSDGVAPRSQRVTRNDGEEKLGENAIQFRERKTALRERISRIRHGRKPLRFFAGLTLVVALIGWAGWGVLRAVPGSALAHWLHSTITLQGLALDTAFLVGAVAATFGMIVLLGSAARSTRRIRALQYQMIELDREAQDARQELGLIGTIDDATVPEVVAALGAVGDDSVKDAVVAFQNGDGAVFVRPDALEDKLSQLRKRSEEVKRSLGETRQRFAEQMKLQQEKVEQADVEAEDLDRRIEVEQQCRRQAEEVQRVTCGLEQKKEDLQRQKEVLRLACELLEGTCRRIHIRFQPELRRFVGKVLPRLTGDRYQHLQIDDDWNVRVFSKEKNDFIGLEEVSNSTHRQLMLCLRLALSQALICSQTDQAPQFIFFDEPFAFFDKQRMAWAVDVLDKVSPQLTQVWLAAQEFGEGSSFDVHLRCDSGQDCLVASGGAAVGEPPKVTAPIT